MPESTFDLLSKEVENRAWTEGQSKLSLMADLYEDKLPSEYDKFFPSGEPKHIVNLVKLAWIDLATQIGRLPELRADPMNASRTEMGRAGLLENIGFGYLRASRPSGKQMMWQLAWWLLAGRAVVTCQPDPEAKTPYFAVRDPRTAYPAFKEVYGTQPALVDNIIFKYELPHDQMKARGLEPKAGDTRGGWSQQGEGKPMGTVIEYLDDSQWIVCSDGGTVKRTEHDLGLTPAHVFQTFSPNKSWGLSQFQGQVTFMVAISRLITQKMAFNDRSVWPITWVKGHEGKIKIGPNVINKLSAQGDMGQIAPPNKIQVDRDIEQLTAFSRILNRNPEVRQGEIQSKGYVAAKTLEQLAEAIDTNVGLHWDIIAVGMQHLFRVAFKMDEMLWPNEEKTTTGVRKGQRYRDKYTPSEDIAGRYYINVEHGFSVGGYQGFLQNLQAVEAKTLPRRRAVESMPGVTDVDQMLHEMELESMDEATHAAFLNAAANGGLDVVLLSEIKADMEKKGWSLNEAILKYQERLAKQAADAMEAGGQGPQPMTTPEPGSPPPQAGPPGLPNPAMLR